MKTRRVALIFLLGIGCLHAQEPYPFLADSLTRCLWHLNEASGVAIHDSSYFHNDGTAFGTAVTIGPFGNARSFNGTSDYIEFPSDSSMSFGDDSFSIDLWVKTVTEEGTILRRGVAPTPGYLISMHLGCIVGLVGADDGRGPGDPLRAQTLRKYNDNFWHHVRMTRNRDSMKVYLYVDDTLAAPPLVDNLTVPIVSDRPLTIGRFENPDGPWFFAGSVDEVRLWSPHQLKRFLGIQVSPMSLAFGMNRLGSTDSLRVLVSNTGFAGTLVLDSIVSSLPDVVPSLSHLSLEPGQSKTISVAFSPVTPEQESGFLSFYCNDPQSHVVKISLSGAGIELTHNPVIEMAAVDQYSCSQAKIVWFRTLDDTAGAADPVTQYDIWVRDNTTISRVTREKQPTEVLPDATLGAPWQFLSSTPAVGFDEYVAVVSHPCSSSIAGYWNECILAAQTVSHRAYLSLAAPLSPSDITNVRANITNTPQRFQLCENFPNPFNPSTTIRFGLPNRSHVLLTIYNTIGQKIAELVNGDIEAGYHEVQFDGSRLASGVYFYRLQAGSFVETRKLLLLR